MITSKMAMILKQLNRFICYIAKNTLDKIIFHTKKLKWFNLGVLLKIYLFLFHNENDNKGLINSGS